MQEIKWVSVTRFIDSYFPQFNSVEIAYKCSKGSNPKYAGKCPLEIAIMWLNTAKEGNNIHDKIEAYLKGESLQLPKYIKNFLNKLLEGYDFLFSEYKIIHEDYKITGRIDAIFKNKKTGKLMICDWKTNDKIDTYNKFENGLGVLEHLTNCKLVKYSLQLNLYKALIQDRFDINDCELIIFHIKEHTVEPIVVKDMEKELALMLYCRGVL